MFRVWFENNCELCFFDSNNRVTLNTETLVMLYTFTNSYFYHSVNYNHFAYYLN